MISLVAWLSTGLSSSVMGGSTIAAMPSGSDRPRSSYMSHPPLHPTSEC
jgi:hypothetical protein